MVFDLLPRRPRLIRFEQAVYGSFAFRDKGYALLGRSPGCRLEWLTDFQKACQNLGERPSGVIEAAGTFAMRLASGPWVVVGVFPQGKDDRGRPGALAFHGLFLTSREYRRAGCNPFAFTESLRDDWTADDQTLAPGSLTVEPLANLIDPPADHRAPAIVLALSTGRPVILESAEPIENLAREVWRRLPEQVRRRGSVATWAFGNANAFDLVAVPRLWGVPEHASVIATGNRAGRPETTPRLLVRSPGSILVVGLAGLLACLGIGLALRDRAPQTEPPAPAPVSVTPVVPESPRFPLPAHDAVEVSPDERRRVAEALTALADRFGVETGADVASRDPAAVMERVSRRLRYHGPFLSEAERAQLSREPGHDPALALQWDALARRFADDRPLPDGFRRGPLRWQLGVFAWSFHARVDPTSPSRSPEEVVQSLAESLALDVAIHPTPLSARSPALASYLGFLGRLPRR